MVPMKKLLTCHVPVAWRRTQEHIVELLRRLRDTQHGNFLCVLLFFMTVHLFQLRLGSILTPFGPKKFGQVVWKAGSHSRVSLFISSSPSRIGPCASRASLRRIAWLPVFGLQRRVAQWPRSWHCRIFARWPRSYIDGRMSSRIRPVGGRTGAVLFKSNGHLPELAIEGPEVGLFPEAPPGESRQTSRKRVCRTLSVATPHKGEHTKGETVLSLGGLLCGA